jgi:hypothetical protein
MKIKIKKEIESSIAWHSQAVGQIVDVIRGNDNEYYEIDKASVEGIDWSSFECSMDKIFIKKELAEAPITLEKIFPDIDFSYSEITSINDISTTLYSLKKLLLEKNERYGNAALEPIGIFDKSESSSILTRIDDKLSRVQNSKELRMNDVVDLLGYLTLLCVENGWTDFNELID